MASTPAMHWHISKFLIFSECIQMFEVFNANHVLLPNTLIVPHFFQYPCINKMLFFLFIQIQIILREQQRSNAPDLNIKNYKETRV